MTLQAKVLETLANASGEAWTVAELAATVDIDEQQTSNAAAQLVKKGLVERVGKGIYRYGGRPSGPRVEHVGRYGDRVVLAVDGVLGYWTPIGG